MSFNPSQTISNFRRVLAHRNNKPLPATSEPTPTTEPANDWTAPSIKQAPIRVALSSQTGEVYSVTLTPLALARLIRGFNQSLVDALVESGSLPASLDGWRALFNDQLTSSIDDINSLFGEGLTTLDLHTDAYPIPIKYSSTPRCAYCDDAMSPHTHTPVTDWSPLILDNDDI